MQPIHQFEIGCCSSDAANYSDEHRGDDAKRCGGNQAREQPLATDHQGARDDRQASNHGGHMGRDHLTIMVQNSQSENQIRPLRSKTGRHPAAGRHWPK